jgi:hypothetical protein
MRTPGPPTPESAIADCLGRMLSRETALGPECVRFIDSTFSNPSPAELARLLRDESNPERDGLLALLLAPDEEHRIAVEPLLESAAGEVDAAGIGRLLLQRVDRVRFGLPDGRGAFEIEPTAALIDGFVAGLAVGRRIPEELRAALRPIADERDRLRACVTLRHAGLVFTPARTAILCRIVGRPEAGDRRFCDGLAFALELLKSVDTEEEIRAFLAERKRRLVEALADAQRQGDMLARAGFEVAQSRGRRLAWVDRAAAELELGFIDRVGLALFGRMPHTQADRIETAFDVGDPADPQPD